MGHCVVTDDFLCLRFMLICICCYSVIIYTFVLFFVLQIYLFFYYLHFGHQHVNVFMGDKVSDDSK